MCFGVLNVMMSVVNFSVSFLEDNCFSIIVLSGAKVHVYATVVVCYFDRQQVQ